MPRAYAPGMGARPSVGKRGQARGRVDGRGGTLGWMPPRPKLYSEVPSMPSAASHAVAAA